MVSQLSRFLQPRIAKIEFMILVALVIYLTQNYPKNTLNGCEAFLVIIFLLYSPNMHHLSQFNAFVH